VSLSRSKSETAGEGSTTHSKVNEPNNEEAKSTPINSPFITKGFVWNVFPWADSVSPPRVRVFRPRSVVGGKDKRRELGAGDQVLVHPETIDVDQVPKQ
jgi:hypothetical protein